MPYFRPVFTLLAVISTVAVQFSTVSAQIKITIGYAAVSPRTTPLYIAQEQGIFAKYGLDPKRDNINILSIGDSVLIGQALEAGRVDAAVLDGALVRRLRSKGLSTIAQLQPAKIPMLNQAVVVHPEFLQKCSETAERIL